MDFDDSLQTPQQSGDKNDCNALLIENTKLEDKVLKLKNKLQFARQQLDDQKKYYQNDNDILYLERDQLNMEKNQYKNDYLKIKSEQITLQKQNQQLSNPENNKALLELQKEIESIKINLQEQIHKNRQLEDKINSINDQREQDMQILKETLSIKEDQDTIIDEQMKKIREQDSKIQTMNQQIKRQKNKIESFKEDKYDEQQEDLNENYFNILKRMELQQQNQQVEINQQESFQQEVEKPKDKIKFTKDLFEISAIKQSSNSNKKAFYESDQLQLVTPPQQKYNQRLVFQNLNIETNYDQGESEVLESMSNQEEVKPIKSNRKNNKSIKFSFNVQEQDVIKDEVIECTTVKKKMSYQECQQIQEFQEQDKETDQDISKESQMNKNQKLSKRNSRKEEDVIQQQNSFIQDEEQQININLDEQNKKEKQQQELKQCNDFDNKIRQLLQLKQVQEEQYNSVQQHQQTPQSNKQVAFQFDLNDKENIDEDEEEQVYNIIQQEPKSGNIQVNWKKVKKNKVKVKQDFIVQQRESPIKQNDNQSTDKSYMSNKTEQKNFDLGFGADYNSIVPNQNYQSQLNNYQSVPVKLEAVKEDNEKCIVF